MSPNDRVEIVAENVLEVVKQLKDEEGADIYLCGGAELATELFKEKLIDEVILKVSPLLLGSGLPLLHDIGRHIDLELIGSKVYSSGVVLLSLSEEVKRDDRPRPLNGTFGALYLGRF